MRIYTGESNAVCSSMFQFSWSFLWRVPGSFACDKPDMVHLRRSGRIFWSRLIPELQPGLRLDKSYNQFVWSLTQAWYTTGKLKVIRRMRGDQVHILPSLCLRSVSQLSRIQTPRHRAEQDPVTWHRDTCDDDNDEEPDDDKHHPNCH